MKPITKDDPFLNPPPGSAAERAAQFGIDLTLTLENLQLTPEERIRKLDDFIAGIAKMKATARYLGTHEEWLAKSKRGIDTTRREADEAAR